MNKAQKALTKWGNDNKEWVNKEVLDDAIGLAAQQWCKKYTEHLTMYPELAYAFAEVSVNERIAYFRAGIEHQRQGGNDD